MAKLDRGAMIDLLDNLGAENDETALSAARSLRRMVSDAGLTWDDLLRTDLGGSDETAEPSTEPAEEDAGDVSDTGKTEAAKLIERLLARKNLSDSLREDLNEMKQNLADGSFDAMDSRYVRALARRLGV